MLIAGGSWAVQYLDGSEYSMYNDAGDEQPWAGINWLDVQEIAFASADAADQFSFVHPGEEYTVRLGARTTQLTEEDQVTGQLGAVRCWMVVTHLAGQPINQESVKSVFFWFPDGSHHTCDDYNCGVVSQYLHELLVPPALRAPLSQSHTHLAVGASAVVA